MRLGAIRLVGVGLFVLMLVCISIFNPETKKENQHEDSLLTDDEGEAVMEFQEFLSGKGGFYEQVEYEMKSKGYEYQLLGLVQDENDIDLQIILTNHEANAEQRKEVIAIFHDIALKNDLDPDIFQLKVTGKPS